MEEKLTITNSAARYIALFLIAIRTFAALTVDGHKFQNSGWLCVIAGLLLSFPLLSIFDRLQWNSNRPGARIISVVIALYMAYEAAALSRVLINSISYSNLQRAPSVLLSLIIYAAGFYTVVKNGRGIGNAHKIWAILFIVLFLIISVASANDFRPKWLFPVLGPGIAHILKGGIKAAGIISSGALILCLSEGKKAHDCRNSALLGASIAMLLCLYWSMMTPMQLSHHTNRLTGIEILLANGRTSLAVLTPMTIVWFMGLAAAVTGCCFTCALFFQNSLKSARNMICAAATVILAFLFANLGLAESNSLGYISDLTYPGLLFLSVFMFIIGKGGMLVEKHI